MSAATSISASPSSLTSSSDPQRSPRSHTPHQISVIWNLQRFLNAFGLGSADSSTRILPNWGCRKARDVDMGNLVSRYCRAEKAARGDAGSHGCLGFVVGVQEGTSAVSARRPADAPTFSRPVSDLRFLTRKDEGPYDLHVLNRRVDDARKIVLESMSSWGKKGPFYKELYKDVLKRHDAKLSSLELEVKLTEKKVSAFRLASKAQEKETEEDLCELFSPLTDEEENIVSDAMWGGNSHEVLVTHEASNIEITRLVLRCLSKGAWLNDEVINVYLELLKEREKREPKRFLKCHFFNTFFYKKLISGRNVYDYKAVRRWTSKRKLGYDLIECDKIFVPIHKGTHWCLAVINVKEKSFTYLDSLGDMDSTVLRVLARYFVDEVKDKSDKHVDTKSWKHETVNGLPLQENGFDCGMFMLKYADFYSRGLSLCFSQAHMPYFRKRTAKEILRLRAE